MGVRVPASRRSLSQADERLLVESAQKDSARFSELYELHFETVYAFVARRASSRDVAEDVTADVFHKALANLEKFEWRGAPFAAWLLRIASNALLDYSRKSGKEVLFDEAPEVAVRDRIEDASQQAQLFRWVNDLPADQRQVVVMRFAEEKSIREIALLMGRSEGAVKQLQFRGLEKLRAWLESKPQGNAGEKKSGGKNG
jgi:RNA polymerase sigma-70 factor (ECF subfamily)